MLQSVKLSSSRTVFALWLLVCVCLSPTLLGEQPAPANTAEAGHPVTVEGQEVLRIYTGIGSFTAEQRAQAVSERLHKLVYDPAADISNVTTSNSSFGTSVVLGNNILMVVTEEDAKQYHLPREGLAKFFAGRIRDAITVARQHHSKEFLVRAAIYGVVTLAIYLLILWLVVVGARRLLSLLQPATQHLKGFKIQQSEIVRGDRIAALLSTGLRLVRVALIFLFTWIFLATEFNYFPWTREHGRRLLDYILTPIKVVWVGLVNYLPNLFYIIVIVGVMYYVAKFVRVLMREIERGNIRIKGFYPEWSQPTYKILRFLLIAFTAVMIFPYLPGKNSPAFKGIGLFIGVLFSLGSTSAVANIIAGVILIYARGFRVGDWVKIGDNMGEITAQTMLATHMKTIKNEEIIIPNSVILGSHVTNYSLLAQSDGLILHTSVTIGYDTPWRQVHSLLINAALKTKYILADPAPFVLQNALEDSYVQYEINAYTKNPLEMVNIYSELHANIQDSFNASAVEIMSPVYSALRDGNKTAIPADSLPAGYRPQGFRISRDDAASTSAGKS